MTFTKIVKLKNIKTQETHKLKKIIIIKFSKIPKLKITAIIAKTKNFKNLICGRRPQMKNSENRLQLKLKNIQNNNFKNYKY